MSSAPIHTASDSAITLAADALLDGELVAIPTETVYGVACDGTNANAIARLYAAKGRPHFNPLIAHVAELANAQQEGVFDRRALTLAQHCWPGPLTLVLPVQPAGGVAELARAGLDSIALRIPAHPVAQALLRAVECPLVAPSANRSGRLSPTRSSDVATELGDALALILDGGEASVGLESTIVAALPDAQLRILRPGAFDGSTLSAIAGEPVLSPLGDGAAVIAPGQLSSHYAPNALVRLEATEARQGERLLAFGPAAPAGAANLSPSGNTTEAAAKLYRLLRDLDASGVGTIAVMPIPNEGLGVAINDRLRRAAAPRPAAPGLPTR
ncbi:MAG: L-threonylcarbamoyladenylate synthase [Pseudomonadota bacterium]